MSIKYRYDHRPAKQRRRRIFGVLASLFLIIFLVVGFILWDLRRTKNKAINGESNTVQQVLNSGTQRMTVDAPLYSLEMPTDWKEIQSKDTPSEHFTTWQATLKNESNRFMTLYIDAIPNTKPINRLLPVKATSNTLSVGDVSENCSTFTVGGTLNVNEAIKLKPSPAKLQGVDFICNLPIPVTENEVGTGSPDGINIVKVTGPTKGTHNYFFLYTDHNIQPNYNIFTDIVKSFRAK